MLKNDQVVREWQNMRRFYSRNVYPKDGEHILIDNTEYVAHNKEENEKCERCCFTTRYGCALTIDKLDCFDLLNDRRIYFEKVGEDNGKEVIRKESKEGV